MANPIDYLLTGLLNALYLSTKNQTSHSLTYSELMMLFEKHYEIPINRAQVELAVARMEHEGLATLVLDPYADTVIETSDKTIAEYCGSHAGVISRGWSNEEWLRSAFRNEKLWSDIDQGVDESEDVRVIPSADGFVTVNHNDESYKAVEEAVVEADEALRSDNELQVEERSWIRVHLEAGISLLRSGGPILRSALVALIIEPLKAAMKAAASEKVKALVGIAIKNLMIWLAH
ncbi:hypothetical protein [Sphingomonas faeni]|uniref:hypothetical protein n=1 Tax=Sphingomonas faeni TaxID=185950 RepID=UPI003358DAFF